MKERGVLLPIFSLPSKYGIGDFGNEAYEFIDILSENGIEYWEILPINVCDRLPYSPISYYALNEDYISLDKLYEINLINKPEDRDLSNRAIYDDFKTKYFEEAFNNFNEIIDEDYNKFIKNIEIIRYSEYMSSKTNKPKEYYLFLQYIIFKQWIELKRYANQKNVRIIGDMPVYPTFDSVETKYNMDCFENENGKFTYEAGTPPDYFNSDGQRWGAPVYNIKYLINDNYKYLIDRYKYYLILFDKIRIDYFRGYDSFYMIPVGKSGKEGRYTNGVSYGFFNKLFIDEKIDVNSLIIEDLGDIREETVQLRQHYGFTRQKILQFAIDLYNEYDKDNESTNVAIFPGNHDCQTMYGWFKNLDEDNKNRYKNFLRKNSCNDININLGTIEYCMKCRAKIVIVTVQDILGLDDSARINVPGIDTKENWSWKLTDFNDFKERIKDFK